MSLQRKITSIRTAIRALSTAPKRANVLANAVVAVDAFTEATNIAPDSPVTALTVSKIWSLVGKLESHVQCADMENCIAHRIVMLSYWRAYEWIEAIFNTNVSAGGGLVYWHSNLVNALIKEFNNSSRTKKGTQTFYSKEYLPQIAKRQAIIAVPRHTVKNSIELNALVSDSFYRIVASWLGYPSSSAFRIQACFVKGIIETLGDVLLMDEVWQTFYLAIGTFLSILTHISANDVSFTSRRF